MVNFPSNLDTEPNMRTIAVAALALLESVQAFQAPATLRASSKGVAARMGEEDLSPDGFGGTLGVLPPLGLFDPLGLIETRDMRRYEIMEIKHGRAAMLGFLHVIHIEAGVRFEGYLSPSQDLIMPIRSLAVTWRRCTVSTPRGWLKAEYEAGGRSDRQGSRRRRTS